MPIGRTEQSVSRAWVARQVKLVTARESRAPPTEEAEKQESGGKEEEEEEDEAAVVAAPVRVTAW